MYKAPHYSEFCEDDFYASKVKAISRCPAKLPSETCIAKKKMVAKEIYKDDQVPKD